MRTLRSGIEVARRSPLALLPMTLEAVVAGVLLAIGAFPADGASAAAAAAFPLDVFFDIKQAVAFAPSWPGFVAAAILSLLVRSAVLGATLWAADERVASPFLAWGHVARWTAVSVLAFVPVAGLFYAGVALRYAPFVWVAGLLGFVAAVAIARRALKADAGIGEPRGHGLPEATAFLGYAYLVSLLALALGGAAHVSPAMSGLLLAASGPLHALFVLGWREHLRAETYPGGGTLVSLATVVLLLGFAGSVAFDRYVYDPAPVGRAVEEGTLMILGGADSTSKTGALADFDPRAVGFARERAVLASYAQDLGEYKASDTRGDLDVIAERVAKQIEAAEGAVDLVGHSQASLILDRMDSAGLTLPGQATVFAAPPPYAPPVDAPLPGRDGPGRVGADLTRAFERLLDLVGLPSFAIDARSSPVRLETVVARDAGTDRMAVWALGDSVWLDRDWRRPGELNVVAISDHVGATRNPGAISATRRFFADLTVRPDDRSWRGILASALRYAFEPWRPG